VDQILPERTGRDRQAGLLHRQGPGIAAVIVESEGEPNKILRVTPPLGVQLVHGTRVIIDNNPPQRNPYVTCSATGCISDYELTAEVLDNLKKGRNLIVQAINSNGEPLTWVLPLSDFAAASGGPATDPSVWEQQRKELENKARKPVFDDRFEPRYGPQGR
jgi:Invasion associated locus B (IalB) protein